MPQYSLSSKTRLLTCDPHLQDIFNEVIKHVDVGITCGHRGQEAQDLAFAEGKSKLRFPASKHNSYPSKAVDFVPYAGGKPIWNNREVIIATAFFIKGVAATMGYKVRLGCDWNGNMDTKDEGFMDAFHVEILEP